jgi:nitrate reductase gamma subunit
MWKQHLGFSTAVVAVLALLAYTAGPGMTWFFGVFIPYAALLIFLIGVAIKLFDWVKSPVPFRIPTTCGQEKSLPWIKQAKFDNPSDTKGVIVRMLLEVLLFRSLFRNTKNEVREGRLAFNLEIWLWLFGLIFHYSFLTVLVRHLRFFLEPVPAAVKFLETIDGMLQIGLPVVMLSGFTLLAAVLFLFARRLIIPQVRYVSLAADYFPLLTIAVIAVTGIWMRYFGKVDITAVKEFTMGLVTFHPASLPETVGGVFYIHIFFVSILFIYFPFSKLMHAGGVFLNPTRNLANNSREKRHVNPWNPDLKFVTYEEYENTFRDKMIEAGLPVEKKE